MSAIATIHTHPRDDTILVVRTPPNDAGDLMAGFEPGTYSPASRGYLVGADMLDHLRRWLARQQVHVVDERGSEPGTETRLNPGRPTHDCRDLGCRHASRDEQRAIDRRGHQAVAVARAAAAQAHDMGLSRGETRAHIDQAVDEHYVAEGITLGPDAQLDERDGWTYHDTRPIPTTPEMPKVCDHDIPISADCLQHDQPPKAETA